MINNFSVHYADLYLNRANVSLFFIPCTLPTSNLPIKRKEETITLIPYYMIPYYMIDILFTKS